jgi:ATP-dependent protease HslVU (ClpYQ) peptidase subunit
VTTIAYRNGIVAADSRVTTDSEAGGSRAFKCVKLFRKEVRINGITVPVILAAAGEAFSGELFVEKFNGESVDDVTRDNFIMGDADFTVLIITELNEIFEVDKWCHMVPVDEEFYAIGSGAKAALGAMHMGASAKRAVEIACKIDPFTAEPVVTMSLKIKSRKRRKDSQHDESERSPDTGSDTVTGITGKSGGVTRNS